MSSGRLQPAAGGIIILQQGDTSQLEDCDALWQSQLQWESDSCGIRRHTPSCLMLMTYRYRRWVCVRRLISLEEPKNNSVNPSASSVSRRLYFSLLMYIFVWAATHTQLLCRMCGVFKTAVKCAGVTPGTYWSVNADVLTEEFCSDVTERARGLPPFISSYISVSWISCSAFNYQLLSLRFSLTNLRHISSNMEVRNCRLVSIDEDLVRPSGSCDADMHHCVCVQSSFSAFFPSLLG